MEKGLREQKNFNEVQNYIEDTGEVNWLVQDAINKEIPIPVISQSIMELFSSNKRSLYLQINCVNETWFWWTSFWQR